MISFPPLVSVDEASPGPIRRILILKLDHIGDLLVAAPALALLRNSFADAHITLICGPWNVGLAKRLELANEVHAVNFFTAGLGEDVSVEARRRAVIETLVALELAPFDLAIDLRRDVDTRALLKLFPARYAAGFGDLATFNYLDVGLPTPADLSGRGATSLRLAPADLDGGAGHAISDRGLHLTAYVGELAVEVRTDAVWPPSDDGIPDTRLLGAALWRVDVRSASDLPGEANTFGDPQEVSREQMRFDGQWLDGEPWGRWSCASRSGLTLRFPTTSPSVELGVRVQGHTSPSHPTATVWVNAAGAEASHVFSTGDGAATLTVRGEATRIPVAATTEPLLLRAGRYRAQLRLDLGEHSDWVPFTVTLRGAHLDHIMGRYTAPDVAPDPAPDGGSTVLSFDFEHRDSAEPLVIEIAAVDTARARGIAIAGLDLDCMDLRAPKLPLSHMEFKLLDLAAMVAIRFARLVPADADAIAARLIERRTGSSATDAIKLLTRRKGVSFWPRLGRTERRTLIGIGIGANKETKLWPEEHFVALCRLLLERPEVDLVFLGGPAEAAPVQRIVAQLGAGERAIDLCSCSRIEDLGEVLALLHGFVGLDTGTTHFAGRVGLRTVSIFGHAHHPAEWGPVGDRSAWVAVDVACRGCSFSRAEQCEIGVACMTGLAPQDVWAVTQRHLFADAANATR